MNKAIINILGLKVEKTHNPTKIIKKALKEKENLRLKPEGWEVLLNIVNTSEFFEKQGTITRYGLIKGEDLIFPEEIYNSKEKILDFLSKFKIILENTIIFLQDIMNFSEKDFPVIKDLKKWIEAKKLWK